MCGFMWLIALQFETKLLKCIRMGITIFKFSFGEVYRSCVAVKLNLRPYIRQYTSPNESFEFSYPLIFDCSRRNFDDICLGFGENKT